MAEQEQSSYAEPNMAEASYQASKSLLLSSFLSLGYANFKRMCLVIQRVAENLS